MRWDGALQRSEIRAGAQTRSFFVGRGFSPDIKDRRAKHYLAAAGTFAVPRANARRRCL